MISVPIGEYNYNIREGVKPCGDRQYCVKGLVAEDNGIPPGYYDEAKCVCADFLKGEKNAHNEECLFTSCKECSLCLDGRAETAIAVCEPGYLQVPRVQERITIFLASPNVN